MLGVIGEKLKFFRGVFELAAVDKIIAPEPKY